MIRSSAATRSRISSSSCSSFSPLTMSMISSRSISATVDVFSVTDVDNQHDQFRVENLIEHAKVADPNSIGVFEPLQFLEADGSGWSANFSIASRTLPRTAAGNFSIDF